jgi:molecular chaperone GrpE
VTGPRPEEDAVRDRLREQPVPSDGEPAAENGAPTPPGGDHNTAPTAAPEPDAGPRPEEEIADAAAEPEVEEDPIAKAERERDEYLALAKRTQADFENFRKRATKDAQASGMRARTGLIREILPAVDNLERALTLMPADVHEGFVEGVRLVHMDLQGVLTRAGVEPIEPKGEKFDPNVHEALSTREEPGAEAGTVLDVIEKGYRSADNVIRPARVVVAA